MKTLPQDFSDQDTNLKAPPKPIGKMLSVGNNKQSVGSFIEKIRKNKSFHVKNVKNWLSLGVVLVLVIGVLAGTLLSRLNQDVRQQASTAGLYNEVQCCIGGTTRTASAAECQEFIQFANANGVDAQGGACPGKKVCGPGDTCYQLTCSNFVEGQGCPYYGEYIGPQ